MTLHFSHRARLTLLATAAALAAAQAQPERPEPARNLVSQDVAGTFIAEALQRSPNLAAANHNFLSAQASIPAAGALPNPRIQLTHFVESIQTRTGPQEQAIMLQQPIPWLSRLGREKDAAKAQAQALWHAYNAQQLNLAEQVATQVFELGYLDRAIDIQSESLRLLVRLQEVVEEQVGAGERLNDLLRLQVETGMLQDQLARLRALRTAQQATLKSMLGRDDDGVLAPLEWAAPEPLAADPRRWLDAALDDSPELAMLRALESSREARARLARLANRPEFTVGVNYIRTGEALMPNTPGSGDDPWALMVGISLPIWSKANNALAREASLQSEAIAAQIESKRLELRAQATGGIARLQDAQARIHRYDTQLLPLARQALENAQASYQANRASVLDLIDSERALLKLQTEYWRAAADAWSARWTLATLSGGLWLN